VFYLAPLRQIICKKIPALLCKTTIVDPNAYLQEYNDFMRWFRIIYPELADAYSHHITIPTDHTGVKINAAGIDKKTCDMLFEIQNEYYLSKHTS